MTQGKKLVTFYLSEEAQEALEKIPKGSRSREVSDMIVGRGEGILTEKNFDGLCEKLFGGKRK